ncbi:CinA family protein [Sphingobacterium sp. 2149]|uniref:CinA family protein n=1 Tax=Sphingobacterium sp. 2149 TaxID=2817763 RepID=UPI001AE66A95|nr:CinA family protein [Sphingobacterium sp. 2149]MDR6737892.1 PncC family amidohydrolase [Sphingobacterium sp. 2149]
MTQIDFPEILLKEVRHSLRNAKARVAIAESVTAGFLQLACSQMEGATEVFAGGITAYSIDAKINILDVDAELAERCDCVSSITTEEMAIAVGRMFHTDWSVATTGYATVVPESKGKLFAFVSFAYKQEILMTETIELSSNIGMQEAQFSYTIKALEILNTLLKN